MKRVHWYIGRNCDGGRFKVLCTKEWVQHPDFKTDERQWYRWDQPENNRLFSTSFREITCPNCIDLILKKKREEIVALERNLQISKSGEAL